MALCLRCGTDANFVKSLMFNKQTGRCNKCESEVSQALGRFRAAFLDFTRNGMLSPDSWTRLSSGIAQDRVPILEALTFIRNDALQLLERTLAFAAADSIVTDEDERLIYQLKTTLAIPDSMAQPIFARLAYLKHITNIRRGVLPPIQTNVRLEAGENCHLDILATYHKVNAKSVTQIAGRFVATNKKLHFLSISGGNEMIWTNVMRVQAQPDGVYIELSKKAGNGFYAVSDPLLTEAIFDTLVRIAKRQILVPNDEGSSRHIPQEVKIAVWQRDQGKCVQCRATDYLEFDHIIPFSKGGASTVGNVQLLCRRCNLQKGDRI